MDAIDAIRWLEFEARRCRDLDSCEAFCLLLPALRSALDLPPMDEPEAKAFYHRIKEALRSDLRKAA